MIKHFESFLNYLLINKGLSSNTISSYKSDLEDFFKFCAQKNIKTPTETDIVDYRSFLMSNQMSNATLQRRYSSIKAFCKFLIEIGVLKHNPVTKIHRGKKLQKLPKYLNQGSVEKMFDWYNNLDDFLTLRNRLILEMFYSTGMRVSELVLVKTVDCVNILKDKSVDYAFLTVCGKGAKERIVPVSKKVLALLENFLQIIKKKHKEKLPKFLFYHDLSKNISRYTVHQVVKQAAIGAGLDWNKISSHVLRHSFATNLLIKGMDIREIQELLGHKDIDTTSIYTKIHNREVVSMMQAKHPFSKKVK
ncbi:MAG: hypothetical protein RL208_498 [Pseudomonadota bacterium]|jgi:integrase/recombinase XerD